MTIMDLFFLSSEKAQAANRQGINQEEIQPGSK